MTAQREQFWALHGQGRPLFDIAAELQVAIRTVYCWIGETGGVRPRVKPAPSGRYLSAEDRDKIAVMVAEGATRAEIAR
ncbi:MAG: hypothetical protein QOG99_1735, partial [Frankiales bacterium]|nr:hypothetical protein [Frankiales bacterium]